MVPLLLAAAAVWEGIWYSARRDKRTHVHAAALLRSRETGKPLLVVGAPDGGVTAGYPCGDVTVDLAPSSACPSALQRDVADGLPFGDNTCVVFVSCVLEYVDRFEQAYAELARIAGPDLFIVRVEPWTATAYLYPQAKRVLRATLRGVR
jgi:hypothetical protein